MERLQEIPLTTPLSGDYSDCLRGKEGIFLGRDDILHSSMHGFIGTNSFTPSPIKSFHGHVVRMSLLMVIETYTI